MGTSDSEHNSKPGRRRILLVDDEPAILMTTEAILEEHYDVVTARSADEALEILTAREVEAVCTDYAMGRGMNGIELLRRVAAMPTVIGRVLVTGQPEVGRARPSATCC